MLTGIKTRLEQRLETIQYQDLKYFYRSLLPFLIRVLEVLLNRDNERVILSIKMIIVEIFSKAIQDDLLIEYFIQILNLYVYFNSRIPKILNSESEEIGVRALKIFIEYYKNNKNLIGVY